MTPETLAALSVRAYRHMEPWSARAFADTLARPQALLTCTAHAFALGLVIAGEAEILALACDPDHQRKGEGTSLLSRFHQDALARAATQVLLEVAAANSPAQRFYARHGYSLVGRREAYYRRADGSRDDALIMRRSLA